MCEISWSQIYGEKYSIQNQLIPLIYNFCCAPNIFSQTQSQHKPHRDKNGGRTYIWQLHWFSIVQKQYSKRLPCRLHLSFVMGRNFIATALGSNHNNYWFHFRNSKEFKKQNNMPFRLFLSFVMGRNFTATALGSNAICVK